MPIPDYQTLMLPALNLGASGEIKISDSVPILSDQFKLTNEERQEQIPSGGVTVIRNRVAWAVVYLVKAGLLHRPKRGIFTITERGKEVLSKNPKKIDVKFLMQYPEFESFKKSKKSGPPAAEENQPTTPEERIGSAYKEIIEEVKSELLDKILNSSPEFFEKLIIKLLISMGYGGSSEDRGTHLGKSGDGGIDGIINEDRLGLDLIYLQAKRYAVDHIVGRPDIQKFAGSLIGFGANKGVFVTTSSFSQQAHDYANNVPQRIILIDGEHLTSLMLQYNVGVRNHQIVELKKLDEDFFID